MTAGAIHGANLFTSIPRVRHTLRHATAALIQLHPAACISKWIFAAAAARPAAKWQHRVAEDIVSFHLLFDKSKEI